MDIVSFCQSLGATGAEEIPVASLVLQPELRDLCARNHCGLYNRNYTCPPAVGEIDALIATLRGFSRAVIFHNVYPLEDSFDLEGMREAKRQHNEMTFEVARAVYAELGRDQALVLSAGGCPQCEICAMPEGKPCRHPEDALASLEAYGVNVAEIGKVSSLRYINGVNTVTYFSGVFY